MPIAMTAAPVPRYRCVFPDWSDPRPLDYFMLENLLEARRESALPTNVGGFDEDVNVYIAGLLTHFNGGDAARNLSAFAHPVLSPPAGSLNRRQRADHYRRNGEHRLVMLGIFDQGDALRRRPRRADAGDRDVGAHCFRAAADLLEGRPGENPALTAIWRKLAENFEDFVQILGTLATRRWDLGARLGTRDLDNLLAAPIPVSAPAPAETDPPPTAAIGAADEEMDRLLDLLLEVKAGREEKRAEVIDLALKLDLDPDWLLKAG